MSYWVELHCDVQAIGRDDASIEHGCWTLRGDNIGKKTINAEDGGMLVRQEATNQGWKKTGRNTWACPFCLKTRA